MKIAIPKICPAVSSLMTLRPDDPGYFDSVVETIKGDAGLTGDLFRVVQSAAFSGNEPPEDLEKALMRIGARRYVSLVLGSNLHGVFAPSTPALNGFWRHTITVAATNQRLARSCSSFGVNPEWAYVIGMLHNVGGMVLAMAAPHQYETLLSSHGLDSNDFREHEVLAFGKDHVEVGTRVAETWKLPASVAAVIAHHHGAVPENSPHKREVVLTQLSLALEPAVTMGEDSVREMESLARYLALAPDLAPEIRSSWPELKARIVERASNEFERLGVVVAA